MALGKVIVGALLSAVASPLFAAPKLTDIGDWTLVDESESCVLSARYHGGTMVSVYADKSEEVMFWIQNPKWRSVETDAKYKLDVEFDAWGEWNQPVQGLKPDGDGFGFGFLRDTADDKDGNNFVAEFMAANTMTISRDNIQIAKLKLTGTSKAVAALLRCVRRKDGDPFDTITPDRPAPEKSVTRPASV